MNKQRWQLDTLPANKVYASIDYDWPIVMLTSRRSHLNVISNRCTLIMDVAKSAPSDRMQQRNPYHVFLIFF